MSFNFTTKGKRDEHAYQREHNGDGGTKSAGHLA